MDTTLGVRPARLKRSGCDFAVYVLRLLLERQNLQMHLRQEAWLQYRKAAVTKGKPVCGCQNLEFKFYHSLTEKVV